MASYDEVETVCEFLRKRVQIRPQIGIICGSGLSQIANRLSNRVVIPFAEIPNFPQFTVEGHIGELVFGTLSGKNLVVMRGRYHAYEGYSQTQITLPVRVMKQLGCEYLFTTNATGSLHPNYEIGDIMVLKDHISFPALAGISALVGPNDERFGIRFPALSDIYTKELRALTLRKAEEMGIGGLMHEGVYVCCSGPNYETPAEARALHLLGADVAGMSTTAETIVAHHCGLKVLSLSVVSNRELFEVNREYKSNHKDVLDTGRQRGDTIATLLTRVIAEL